MAEHPAADADQKVNLTPGWQCRNPLNRSGADSLVRDEGLYALRGPVSPPLPGPSLRTPSSGRRGGRGAGLGGGGLDGAGGLL